MADERAWLAREVAAWQEEGIVTDAQARAILSRYAAAPAVPGAVDRSAVGEARAAGSIVNTVSAIGAILVGLGVILFFASNWQEIPRALRVVLLVAATGGAFYAGWEMGYRRGTYPRVGEALVFLGVLLYGATIFLVAQMYHVNADALPDLLLLWAVGAFPVAYAFRTAAASLLGAVLTLAWIDFRVAETGDATFEGFAVFHLAIGVLLYGAGRLHAISELTRPHVTGLRLFGFVLMAGALFVLTFAEDPEAPEGALLVATFLAVAAGAGAVWLAHVLSRGASSRLETDVLLGVAAVGLVFPLLPQVVDRLPANLLLAALLVAFLVIGYRSRDVLLVHVALVFVVVDVFARYFDWFYDLLDRSVFFILGGLLLLAGAWWGERQRRALVQRMRAGPAPGGGGAHGP